MRAGIEKIKAYLPAGAFSIEDVTARAGISQEISNAIRANGVLKVRAWDPAEPLCSIINRSVKDFIAGIDNAGRISRVIIAHSAPFISLAEEEFIAECLEGTNIYGNARCYLLSGMPCAVMHAAAGIAAGMAAGHSPCETVLLIGADRANSDCERIYFNTAMSDSVVIMAISKSADHGGIIATYTDSLLIAVDGENSPAEEIGSFRSKNPLLIRDAIIKCAETGNIPLESVKYFITHTPNFTIWDSVAKLSKIERARFLTDYLPETGHMCSNDSFAHFTRALEEGRIGRGDIVMLVNPGFGGTRGCTLIKVS